MASIATKKYDLSKEAERLHKSTKRFVFCNPSARFSEFSPKAAGIRAILPHVDDCRPIHNLDSLADLVAALRQEPRLYSGGLSQLPCLPQNNRATRYARAKFHWHHTFQRGLS